MDLPEEGIQIAPVYLERFVALESELAALEQYYETAANVYIKTAERLKNIEKEIWSDIRREYAIVGDAWEVTQAGQLIEIKPETPAPIK